MSLHTSPSQTASHADAPRPSTGRLTSATRRPATRFLTRFAGIAMLVLGLLAVLFSPTPAAASQPSSQSSEFEFAGFLYDLHDPAIAAHIGFSDTWGAPRSGGRRHKGTDVYVPKHVPVLALASGVVTRMGYHRLSGRYIEITHNDGWATVYMHLNNDEFATDNGDAPLLLTYAPGIEVGSLVLAGDVIAFAGDSGNAEGTVPHTHLALKHDGTYVDPYPYLRTAYRRAVLAAGTHGIYAAGNGSYDLLPVRRVTDERYGEVRSLELLSSTMGAEE